jgi:flagellar biosynthetic protein FlhB
MAQKDSKTEWPTQRRLQKAREKGQVARSREVPAAAALLGGLLFLAYYGNSMLDGLRRQLIDFLRMTPPEDFSISFVYALAQQALLRSALLIMPLMLLLCMLGVATNIMQGGLAFSSSPLGFHFERLMPKNGFSRVFSKNGTVELAKSLIVILVISYLGYQVVVQHLSLYPRLVLMDARQLLYWTGSICFQVCLKCCIFLVIIAILDYAFQKYRFLEGMKMTKQEVKDDFKEMEGDPFTRGRIRRIQRELARKRMMAAVPEADVVITNPTHYAVALAYKMEEMEAPRVVAKGVGFLAIKIKELAQQHDIPMVENPTLAQTLYQTVEVGAYIPVTLYRAVAQILAYIYKTRNKWRG